jgi:hypothetical protein
MWFYKGEGCTEVQYHTKELAFNISGNPKPASSSIKVHARYKPCENKIGEQLHDYGYFHWKFNKMRVEA